MFRSKVAGVGSFLPEKVITNFDLEKMVETSSEWIIQRTGIERRHMVDENEGTSDMCVRAGNKALAHAGMTVDQIDLIIVCTLTPDYKMPAAACLVQAKLGARNIMSFDLNAACSGFVYGLFVADQFIKTGVYKNVMVFGAENLTRLLNYKDRDTCILFGDAAGCFIMTRAEENDPNYLMTAHAHAEGSLAELLWAKGGGTRYPFSQEVWDTGSHYMQMKGKEIFKNATRTMATACHEAMDAVNLKPDQIDWIVPHQANMRITEAVASHLDFPMEKIVSTVHETGNTSAASIPVAFDIAMQDGRIQRGQTILLTAFGAGLTSGSAILRF
ncbi:MAG: ketoacyl-ACP synthase III [Bdellovibrio sp.]|nr:ketoacyl-ACP synthase III [Bdellovibrio sp.]